MKLRSECGKDSLTCAFQRPNTKGGRLEPMPDNDEELRSSSGFSLASGIGQSTITLKFDPAQFSQLLSALQQGPGSAAAIQQIGSDLKWLINEFIQFEGKEETDMADVKKDIVSLQAQVTANTTVEASAITLINGIAAQLATAIASGNPAQLDALQAQLATSATALAAAVTANTPAAPAAH